ncbi:HEPN-associated N-terminal domain-containing protein [Phenylobacterium sp.]|uniref:HEPN-associated N-terminal domain-containing protein n=1 Tax=Phenylobacterium sp. TaxID=1871053 RepID=UPI0030F4073F
MADDQLDLPEADAFGLGLGHWGELAPEPEPRRRWFEDDLPFGDWAEVVAWKSRSRPDDLRQVCDACVSDAGLARFITYFAEALRCDFCGRRYRTPRAAPFAELVPYIEGCLRQDYDQPENVLFLDPESESGFAGTVYDNEELLADWLVVEQNLFDAIVDAFDPDLRWCESDQARFLPEQHLEVSWTSFCSYVKHTSRFMFLRPDEQGRRLFDTQDSTLVSSTDMLDLFGDAAETCGLITTLGVRTKLFRARALKPGEPWFATADDLGPPPETDTGPPANRMSPAGIAHFYAALDEATALRESTDRSGRVALGAFSPVRPLRLLDLRSDRPVPHASIFDGVPRLARGLPGFVEAFREEISRPVTRDGREHIDYVPSQIVTEYIRRVFRTADGEWLDGVLYPSTRQDSGACVALFVSAREIVGSRESWGRDPILRFRPRSPCRRLVRVRRGRMTWTEG